MRELLPRLIADSPVSILAVTNWWGGYQKTWLDRGHSNNIYPEFELLLDAVKDASAEGKTLDFCLVYEDIYRAPELCVSRLHGRQDQKFIGKTAEGVLQFAAGEVSDIVNIMSFLHNETKGTDVSVSMRVTRSRICAPTICTERGVLEGRQRNNLSDHFAPADLYSSNDDGYAEVADSARVCFESSVAIVGKDAAPEYAYILHTMRDPVRLAERLCHELTNNPAKYPEFYKLKQPDGEFHFTV